MPIRNVLPKSLRTPLWGDRERWGLTPVLEDLCWQEYQGVLTELYAVTQRQGIGQYVNDAGYAVMSSIDLTGKNVLEIGAGDIRHMKFWRGEPAEYVLADVSDEMMAFAKKRVEERGISYRTLSVERNQALALEDASVDVIVSFYSLEHLYPLRPYLDEFKRLLKPGGYLIGAIPAEGGLAWGAGECSPHAAGSRRTPLSIRTRSSAGSTPTSQIRYWANSIRCLRAKPFNTGRYHGCHCSIQI